MCTFLRRRPCLVGCGLVLITISLLDKLFGVHGHILDYMVSSITFFRTKTLNSFSRYIGMHVSASMLCLPLTPFEILSGFIYGFPEAIFVDTLGRLLGALASFQIARCLLYNNRQCYCLTESPALKGIGLAVQEQGLRFLVLFNMSYVPVAVKNYGLGFVPEVPLLKFLAAILIIEVPLASVWAFIGNAAAQELESEGISFTNTTEIREALQGGSTGSAFTLGLFALGVLSIFVVIHFVHQKVSKELSPTGGTVLAAPIEHSHTALELRSGLS